jgi:hypothetical protein
MVSLSLALVGANPFYRVAGLAAAGCGCHLFSHIAARRIPADRYKMYGHKPTLHDADAFIAFGLLAGSLAILLFIYLFYEILLWRGMAILAIIALLLVSLLERKNRNAEIR